MRIAPLVLALALSACGDNDKPAQPPAVVVPQPPSPAVWQFQYSPGMTSAASHGEGGFAFQFPSTDGVHYLVKGFSGSLARLSITYTIVAPEGAVFDYRTKVDNTCGPGHPGTVTLYFQRMGDTWYDEFGRWFAWAVNEDLRPGTFTMAMDISQPENWGSVYAKKGNEYPNQFQAASSNVGSVGVVFGGGCFAGHGVFVTGGTATMSAVSFVALNQ